MGEGGERDKMGVMEEDIGGVESGRCPAAFRIHDFELIALLNPHNDAYCFVFHPIPFHT